MPRQFPWTKCQTPCALFKLKLSLDFVSTTNTDSTPTLSLLNTQHRIHRRCPKQSQREFGFIKLTLSRNTPAPFLWDYSTVVLQNNHFH